jgi:hypothetical protein
MCTSTPTREHRSLAKAELRAISAGRARRQPGLAFGRGWQNLDVLVRATIMLACPLVLPARRRDRYGVDRAVFSPLRRSLRLSSGAATA